ncbi:MAG: NAD(P)H-binding protein [Bdellovibrionales bacterium]|nr:NAD(P)H-binding protein [Bdellovibrionales bacterium]
MIQTLVTGGTGFVGASIVRALVNAHESVKVVSRDPIHISAHRRVPGAYYVQGDILDQASLDQALSDCDAIIHCVQFPNAPFEDPTKGWTYENIDGHGTEVLTKAAKDKGITRMLYISGMGAGQNRSESWFVAKDRAEKAIMEHCPAWTIFRPSWIYGPQDQSLNRLIAHSQLPLVFPIIGNGKQKVAPLYIEDLAKAVVYCLNREKSHKKTFEMGGPEIFSFVEMMKIMLSVVGKKRILLPIPKSIIKFLADFINILPITPVITRDGVDFICMDVQINVSETHAFFDYEFTKFQKGLSKYL